MRQPDRRRALISGSSDTGSGWDLEFYAAKGVLPPSGKMTTDIVSPGISSQSTAAFVNGYYRLNGINSSSSGAGGIAMNVNPSYLGTAGEAECAFYIRNFSFNGLALQLSLRSLNGIDFIVRVQNDYVCVFYQVGSNVDKLYCSRRSNLNTRYVLRCELDSINRVARVYINDELIVTRTGNYVTDSNNYACQVMAVSAGYSSTATVDIEYFKYRRL
ncbi:MAG: hypothetical protein K5756_04805 [Clostridiales bacterium]|nr:hypothetical protein [Clostridiales bacterium]